MALVSGCTGMAISSDESVVISADRETDDESTLKLKVVSTNDNKNKCSALVTLPHQICSTSKLTDLRLAWEGRHVLGQSSVS